jgi:hypothetical protein
LKKLKSTKEIENEFYNPRQKDISKQYGFYVSLVHEKFVELRDLIKT